MRLYFAPLISLNFQANLSTKPADLPCFAETNLNKVKNSLRFTSLLPQQSNAMRLQLERFSTANKIADTIADKAILNTIVSPRPLPGTSAVAMADVSRGDAGVGGLMPIHTFRIARWESSCTAPAASTPTIGRT